MATAATFRIAQNTPVQAARAAGATKPNAVSSRPSSRKLAASDDLGLEAMGHKDLRRFFALWPELKS